VPYTEVMHKWKTGHLFSGGGGKKVTSQKQAEAIMLSEKEKAMKGKKEYQPAAKRRMPAYGDGGVVEATGPATVHKGELIVPADHAAHDAIEALLKDAEQGKSASTKGDESARLAEARRKSQGQPSMMQRLKSLATGGR